MRTMLFMELPEELIDKATATYARARLAGQHVDDAEHEPDRATFNAMAAAAKLVPDLVQAIRERSVTQDPKGYFDTHAIGALVQAGYNGSDEAVLSEGVDVYECEDCGALVRDIMQQKHITQHELRAALLKQLGNAAHSHGVIA